MKDYPSLAVKLGALDAKFISPATVVTAPWVVMKCRYGCRNYNKRPCCPPSTPTYLETREIFNAYSVALCIQCAKSQTVNEILRDLMAQAGQDGYYKALAFGAKTCQLCVDCTYPDCKQPHRVIPQLDGCGVDVFSTVRNNGYEIETVSSREDPRARYYGILLVE